MHNFFVNDLPDEQQIKITGNDVNHIKNVLRLKAKDKIYIHINKTIEKYLCEITKVTENEVNCCIIEKIEEKSESNVYINIIQALPKFDKMELIIQKCTELGVSEFTPLELNRCIVKLNEKDVNKKIERWQNIAEVAAKQSGRDILPIVNTIYTIKNIQNLVQDYDLVLVAYENEKNDTLKQELIYNKENFNVKKIAIIIGPEGGFEESEIEKLKEYNYKIVSLGNRILRTETVSIVLSGIIMYILGDLGGN